MYLQAGWMSMCWFRCLLDLNLKEVKARHFSLRRVGLLRSVGSGVDPAGVS